MRRLPIGISARALSKCIDEDWNVKLTFIKRLNSRIHVEERGEGPPVVLVHGLGGCIDLWRRQIPALSREYRVVALDVRGFGQSTLLEAEPSFTMDDLVEDVVAICAHFGLEGINFVGSSMGGFIGQKLAVANPGLCRTLTLCFTACKSGIPPEVVQSRLEALRTQPMSDLGVMVAGQALAPLASSELAAWLAAIICKNDPRVYSHYLQEIIGKFSACEEAGKINLPTLVISGSYDRVIPGDLGYELHAHIPQSEFHLMEGVGHIGYAEQPEQFNDLLLAFLARHNGKSSSYKAAVVESVP